jgi:hypothetical protein
VYDKVKRQAPSHFSIADNPRESVSYLNSVHRALRVANVHADLAKVSDVTPDALLALVTYADRRRGGTKLTGSIPQHKPAKKTVETCGFAELVRGLEVAGDAKRGFVETRTMFASRGHEIDGAIAQSFVLRACRLAQVPYSPILYSNLVECMANTNNHAGQEPGSISWRLMAAFDEASRLLRFVFMDPGRGICKTARRRLPSISDDSELLMALLNPDGVGVYQRLKAGLPHSTRTRMRGRGRGLRKIAQSVDRGALRRLVVVANEGYVDVGARRSFRLNDGGFHGTLIYWEVQTPPEV